MEGDFSQAVFSQPSPPGTVTLNWGSNSKGIKLAETFRLWIYYKLPKNSLALKAKDDLDFFPKKSSTWMYWVGLFVTHPLAVASKASVGFDTDLLQKL